MYKVLIVFVCFLALLISLIFQTQTAAFVSMAIVLVAAAYGVYKSPREKRLPIVVFMVVAVPLVIVLGNYLD